MNLTGNWQGYYKLGRQYPKQLVGRSYNFTFELTDDNGNITGTCIDNLVKAKAGNESSVIGTFQEKVLKFKKSYKYHLAVTENGDYVLEKDTQSNGVDYYGKLKREFFSRKIYFSGKWLINYQFNDDEGITQNRIVEGTWKMFKID